LPGEKVGNSAQEMMLLLILCAERQLVGCLGLTACKSSPALEEEERELVVAGLWRDGESDDVG